MTYLGAEPEDTRQSVLAHWVQQLGLDTTWSFTPFMSSERELLTWKAEGMGAQQDVASWAACDWLKCGVRI